MMSHDVKPEMIMCLQKTSFLSIIPYIQLITRVLVTAQVNFRAYDALGRD